MADHSGAVREGVKDEVQLWRENLKMALYSVKFDHVGDEAPWLRVMTVLNIGKSGASAIVPKLAETALKRVAIPVFFLETASSEFARLYKKGARITNDALDQKYRQVLGEYCNAIDKCERDFWKPMLAVSGSGAATSLGGHVQQKIEKILAARSDVSGVYPWTRALIAKSQIVPTDNATLLNWAQKGFSRVYARIKQLYRNSPLHEPNLSDLGGPGRGHTYIQPPGPGETQVESFRNLGEMQRVCFERNYDWNRLAGYFGVPDCFRSITAAKVESAADFRFLLNNAWSYEISVNESRPNHTLGSGLVTLNHIEVQPIPGASSQTRGMPFIHSSLPTVWEALEKAATSI